MPAPASLLMASRAGQPRLHRPRAAPQKRDYRGLQSHPHATGKSCGMIDPAGQTPRKRHGHRNHEVSDRLRACYR